MIVVVNPSGSAGRSFKGLHAYCAHDQDRADTSERVDWIDMRNIAANDPNQAWKVMAATAGAQHELKRAAGVRAGRTSKEGAVMHVVLSFDKDEPADRETMQTAADEFLGQLGVDPAKMRGKSKPKRRQFAEEHQVMMYAHTDTDHAHLHLMINTVHPEHGVKLPTNNNFSKAQKWAEEFSKRHGTDHKTPAREENREMREAGEYVKGERRKSRNIYELEQALAEAGNDNDQLKAALDQERKKDAALAMRGRNMAAMQARARSTLVEGHKSRKAALARQLQRGMNKSKAEVREAFRPEWRKLRRDQESERKTFDALETSFFGRASNAAKAVRLSAQDIGGERTGIISRTFRILTKASERKAYFEAAQERARKAVQRQQAEKVSEAATSLKDAQAVKMADNRAVFMAKCDELKNSQQAERDQLKAAWKERTVKRAAAMDEIAAKFEASKEAQAEQKASRKRESDPRSELLEAYAEQVQYDQVERKAAEQDNQLDQDWDITDDD